jgi:hypothetical protein
VVACPQDVTAAGTGARETCHLDADAGPDVQPDTVRVRVDEREVDLGRVRVLPVDGVGGEQRTAGAPRGSVGTGGMHDGLPGGPSVMLDGPDIVDRGAGNLLAAVGELDRVEQRHLVVAAQHRRVVIDLPRPGS